MCFYARAGCDFNDSHGCFVPGESYGSDTAVWYGHGGLIWFTSTYCLSSSFRQFANYGDNLIDRWGLVYVWEYTGMGFICMPCRGWSCDHPVIFSSPALWVGRGVCVRVRWACISTGPLKLWDWSSGRPGRCGSLRCIGWQAEAVTVREGGGRDNVFRCC